MQYSANIEKIGRSFIGRCFIERCSNDITSVNMIIYDLYDIALMSRRLFNIAISGE